MYPARTETKLPRSLHLALFAIGLLWLLAARVGAESAAQGIARLLHQDVLRPLLREAFLLVLLPTGFTALNWVATRNGSIRLTNALPTRATGLREWQKGTALGWGLALVAILPMALAGDLHPQFWTAPRAWALLLLSVFTVLLGSLATELAFRGFLFRRLIAAVGPFAATVLLTAIYAFVATGSVNTTPFSFSVSLLAGFLFSMAYLRTHALWLGWGLRFGWLVSLGVLFGLPLAGVGDYATVVATDSSGQGWLTGGAYGPEGSLLTALVLLGGMVALYRMTRDYAWSYTLPVIVPGGYPMEVAPPPAHVAMEAAAVPATPLVQILGTTSTGMTTAPVSLQPVPLRAAEAAEIEVEHDGGSAAGEISEGEPVEREAGPEQ